MGIADEMKKLSDDIIASYDERVKSLRILVKDVQKTLKGFAADRKRMSKEQAKELADFVSDLTNDVDKMIKGFQKEHKALADALKKEADTLKESLKNGEADRLKDFNNMMGDIQKGVKDIETYVKNKLKEFSDAHADMGAELKKDLAKYVEGITSEITKLLGGFEGERKKAASHWKAMSDTLAKKRGIKVEAEEPKPKARPMVEAEVRPTM